MKNHFHIFIKVKKTEEIGFYKYSDKKKDLKPSLFREKKWETTTNNMELLAIKNKIIPNPQKHFSHLFNSYTKHFNKKYNRRGCLFERPYKRILLTNKSYMRNLIIYIHNNPVHHGFVEHPIEYPWSSYLNYLSSSDKSKINESLIEFFGDIENCKVKHNQKLLNITKILQK